MSTYTLQFGPDWCPDTLTVETDEDGDDVSAVDQHGFRYRRIPDIDSPGLRLRGCWIHDDETDTTEDEFDAMWREAAEKDGEQ